jgi:hypothetical protein
MVTINHEFTLTGSAQVANRSLQGRSLRVVHRVPFAMRTPALRAKNGSA